jgi:hypothetical protein
MEITKEYVQSVVDSGHFFLRLSNNGRSYRGFQWNPIGEWTEAPDWNPVRECGNGLHGNKHTQKYCTWSNYQDVDFCEYDPSDVADLWDNIKVKHARVLLRNELPEGLKEWKGGMNLYGTNIKFLPDNLTVGGDLSLMNSNIRSLPNNLTVEGSLNIRGSKIKTLPDNLTVGEVLDIRLTDINTLPGTLKVTGPIYENLYWK